jgi:predicted HicB family RNase H-like nuclease
MKKKIDYYMNLPYKIELYLVPSDEGGGIFLEIPELGRLSTNAWGATFDDACAMLDKIKRRNIEDMLEQGLEIPEPLKEEKNYSGHINLRLSPSLHHALAEMAKKENISQNALINNLLHQSLGANGAYQHFYDSLIEGFKDLRVFRVPDVSEENKKSYQEKVANAARQLDDTWEGSRSA